MLNTFQAHCPRCNGERTCYIHGEILTPWSWNDETNVHSGEHDYKLAQCCGCKEVFLNQSSWDSEEWDTRRSHSGEEVVFFPKTVITYPPPEKKSLKPDWVWNIAQIDPQLFAILREMYQAYEHGSFILASVGLRTAFDRTTELLKIDPAIPLEQKVKLLLDNGYIGETESLTLKVVIDAGSAAAHRAWSPRLAEFEPLLTTLEQFVYRTIIVGKAALSVADSIPSRPSRQPKQPK